MSIPTQRKPDYKSAWIFPILGIIAAFTYALLVFPNSFAPAGVGGISTMLQYALKVDAGILNLIINVPILITAWFLVDREFVIKSMLFTAFFSGGMIALRAVDPAILARYQYTSTNGNSTILAPIAAAVIIGSLYGVTLRKHGCTGGTDVISFCIKHYHPEYNVAWISFTLNAVIAVVSFFVYGHQFEPVICCIIYCVVCSYVCNSVVKGEHSALKFEIVSEEPEKLAADLMEHLKHGVTMLPAEGAYTHERKSLVICIVNKHQIADIQSIIARYPGSFTYITSVSETLGNFRKIK
jgi:uncharacterized membrane-anchored protein YitT (DUF2179 family)